jgi:hypothetical protein
LNNNELSFTGGDGLSIKNAVIIFGAKSDEEGVIAEQLYLACPIPVI